MKSAKKHGDKQPHDPNIDELITRLEAASKRLNSAARQATRRIESLEERLLAVDPGVEIWGPVLLTGPTRFQREGSETTEAAERVLTLGYGKLKKDRWGLAIRELVKASGGGQLSETTYLLSKAERQLRLLALPHLTNLTRQIVEAVEAQTVGLEDSSDDETVKDESPADANEFAGHADN